MLVKHQIDAVRQDDSTPFANAPVLLHRTCPGQQAYRALAEMRDDGTLVAHSSSREAMSASGCPLLFPTQRPVQVVVLHRDDLRTVLSSCPDRRSVSSPGTVKASSDTSWLRANSLMIPCTRRGAPDCGGLGDMATGIAASSFSPHGHPLLQRRLIYARSRLYASGARSQSAGAGTPPTTVYGSTLPVTTAPAATTALPLS